MLTSMTGFGRAEVPLPPAGRAIVEIHTLNHKFLEVECRLPDGFQGFEEQIRSLVNQEFRRGRVKISVALKAKEVRSPVVFQTALARQYMSQLRGFQRKLRIPGEVDLNLVLGLPQVISSPEPDLLPTRWWPHLKEGVSQALVRAVKMRRQEGQRLEGGLRQLLQKLESLRRKVQQRVPVVQRGLEKRLATRIQAIVPTADSRAIAAEAASVVQATDVTEELGRLQSHLTALYQVVSGESESPGRTIDFLAQELHREINTLGSKIRDTAVIRHVVAMKGHIEKLREQAANVE